MFAKISQALQAHILTFAWFELFWEGLSRFREVEKLVHGSMHIVLPLELMKRFQPWLWYSSPQNMEAEVLKQCSSWLCEQCSTQLCWAVLSWVMSHGTAPGAAEHGRTPSPWTAPGEKLICDGALVSHQNRSTERPKRRWLTSNTWLVTFWPRAWTFSGLRGMGILSFG